MATMACRLGSSGEAHADAAFVKSALQEAVSRQMNGLAAISVQFVRPGIVRKISVLFAVDKLPALANGVEQSSRRKTRILMSSWLPCKSLLC